MRESNSARTVYLGAGIMRGHGVGQVRAGNILCGLWCGRVWASSYGRRAGGDQKFQPMQTSTTHHGQLIKDCSKLNLTLFLRLGP